MDQIANELGSHDEELRRLAVVAMAEHPLDRTGELLFSAMGDQSWRVRKEAVSVLVGCGTITAEIIEGLIALLRSHDNAGLRNSAVESLERLGPLAVEPLCGHLNDHDQDLRKFIIDILGNIGATSCVPLLLRAMDDPDANVRSGAVENLGKIGDPRALPHLLEALKDGDVWFKFAILDALAAIGIPVPLAAIAPLMQENLLRRAIYDCLGAVGGADCLPLLLEGVQERARTAREAAVAAVMRLRGRLSGEAVEAFDATLKGLKGTPYLDGLLRSLGCADGPVLEAVVGMLGIIGDRRAAMPLLAVSRHERLRPACVQAFRGIGAEVLPELWDQFPTVSPDERAFIAYLTGELRYLPGGSRLLEGLRDEAASLRSACLLSLGKLATPGAARKMAQLLADREPRVRSAALVALERLIATDAFEIAELCAEFATAELPERRRDAAQLLAGLGDGERLSLLAKDENAMVRKAAVASLARVRNPQTAKHLVMALVDEVPEVRVAAAAALGEVGGAEALEPLLLALNDSDPWMQVASLKGLAALKNPGALAGVAAHVSQAQGFVLIAGLKTLAAVGGAQALEPVRQALGNSDEEVVEAAIDILSRYGDQWIADCRDQLLRHPHWGVRRCFVRVMGEVLGERALPYLKKAEAQESDSLVKAEIQAVLGRFS